MKSRSTYNNFEILTIKKSLVYFVDLPVNYSPTMKDDEELASIGFKLKNKSVNYIDLLT